MMMGSSKVNDIKQVHEFYAIINQAFASIDDSKNEYSRNIHTIEQTLDRIELIPKLKS
jgi:hypothetical protein